LGATINSKSAVGVGVMVPGIGRLFGGEEVIQEIIKPLLQQGLF
jgi:hypothetical protein